MADQSKLDHQNVIDEQVVGEKNMSQWQLMWRRFKRNKLAQVGGVILLILYLTALFGHFIAPYSLNEKHSEYIYAPPQRIHFVDEKGNFSFQPFVYGVEQKVNMETLEKTYEVQKDEKRYINFLVEGSEYKLAGLIPMDTHLFGVEEGKIFLLGADKLGRDLFSQICYALQISLTVGLLGVFLTTIFGSVLGVISGYYGGIVDMIMQRMTEVLMAFPDIPLWMALGAALPHEWSSIKVYFGLTLVLAVVRWGGLARQIRGMVLSLRETEYVKAARNLGARDHWIIFRHLLPNCLSHIIVMGTLAIPGMILAETGLSFLGLGIQPPMTSLGVLLQQAQRVSVIVNHPWMLIPALFVVATVLAYNFVGDGLRDAADPYSD